MARTLLSWYIGVSATLILIVQVLSLGHMIAPVPLLIALVLATIVVLFVVRRHALTGGWSLRLPALELLHPLVIPFVLTLPPIIVFLFALGWHMPPNNWDSMTYHLSRAAYWRQWQSLAHFPTNNVRQNVFPGNAEVLILVTLLLAHSATFAFLVQFTAYLATIIAVYGLGRQLSLHPPFALVGAGAFATLPEVVLQSTSTQNDLVVAAFMASGVYLVVDAIRRRCATSLALAIVATGLALGTKPTAFLAVPGIGLGVMLLALQSMTVDYRVRATRRDIMAVVMGIFVAFVMMAPWYLANWTDYGNPSGPPLVAQNQAVAHPSLETMSVNLLRYGVAYLDPEGPALLTPQTANLTCTLIAQARRTIVAAIPLPKTEPMIEWPGSSYSPIPNCQFNEDTSWFGLIGWLAVGSAIVWSILGLAMRKWTMIGVAWLLSAGCVSFLVFAALLLRWQPWQGRLLIVVAALSSPLLGLLAQRIVKHRFGRLLLQLMILYAVATALTAAIDNVAKPLNAWGASRPIAQVLTRPEIEPILGQIKRSVPEKARLGIFITEDDWDFPLFGPHLDRTVEPLVMPAKPTKTQRSLPYSQEFDYLLTHQPASKVDVLLHYLTSEQCSRRWSIGGSGAATSTPWSLFFCAPRNVDNHYRLAR